MLTLRCPYCGLQVCETELTAAGEAHLKRQGPGASDKELETYLFTRQNPKGVHLERWRHSYGCGKFFLAARDTTTNEVFGTYKAQTPEPPAHIQSAITARHPNWRWKDLA